MVHTGKSLMPEARRCSVSFSHDVVQSVFHVFSDAARRKMLECTVPNTSIDLLDLIAAFRTDCVAYICRPLCRQYTAAFLCLLACFSVLAYF